MSNDELTAEIEAAVEKVEIEKEEGITDQADKEEVIDDHNVSDTTESTETTEIEETTEIIKAPDTEETTDDPVTPPALSNEILERAVRAGIPVADARELGQESLNRIFKAQEEEYRLSTGDAEKITQSPDEEVVEVVDPFADFPKLDPEVHDEATIAAFEKLRDIAKQQQEQIGDFRTRQEDAERDAKEANRRDTVQWFDKQVENLGEDFVDALGTGGYDSLDQGSTQFAKREELADQVSVLLAGYKATGRQSPPRDEVFDVAARLVLNEEYQQIKGKKLSGDLKKRASQHIQRAGGQKATGKETPQEEAARVLDEKYSL